MVFKKTGDIRTFDKASVCQEAICLKKLDCEIFRAASKDITIYCKNKSTVFMSQNGASSKMTKHIDVRMKFLREAIKNKLIKIVYISSKDNLEDIHTKPITSDCQTKLTNLLGLKINI